MAIKYKVCADGKAQSFSFTTEEGRDVMVCVLEEGSYDFGVTHRREEIQVLTGRLYTHSCERSWDSDTAPLVFEVAATIKFRSAPGTTSYICFYD